LLLVSLHVVQRKKPQLKQHLLPKLLLLPKHLPQMLLLKPLLLLMLLSLRLQPLNNLFGVICEDKRDYTNAS
jgi:hypothetical protein